MDRPNSYERRRLFLTESGKLFVNSFLWLALALYIKEISLDLFGTGLMQASIAGEEWLPPFSTEGNCLLLLVHNFQDFPKGDFISPF